MNQILLSAVVFVVKPNNEKQHTGCNKNEKRQSLWKETWKNKAEKIKRKNPYDDKKSPDSFPKPCDDKSQPHDTERNG